MYGVTNIHGQHPHGQRNAESSTNKKLIQFATTPLNTQRVVRAGAGPIEVEDPSLAWPHQYLERRRVFRGLFTSYQKRISRVPFRPFTVLSARALAAFLASQDFPAQELCPNEPVRECKLVKPPDIRTLLEDIEDLKILHRIGTGSEKRKKPRRTSKMVNFNRSETITRQLGDSTSPQTDNNGLGRDAIHVLPSTDVQDSLEQLPKAQSRKDMKSFAQRLFDTKVFDSLHTVSVLTESSDRIPWLSIEPECNDVLQGKNLGRVSPCVKGTERMAKLPTESVNLVLNSAVFVSEPHIVDSPSSQTSFGHSDPSMIRAKVSGLSHFTLDNIEAIKEAITEHGLRGLFDEQDYLRSIGRPSMPMKLAAFQDGSTNERERTLAFATQYIVNVLGSVDHLLSSFRDPPYAWGEAINESTSTASRGPETSALRTLLSITSFAETWAAFSYLKQVDSHPANILPSLRMSLLETERFRFTYHYPIYSLNVPELRGSVCEDRKISGTLDLGDILHLVNIVLAALAASVPLCNPDEWWAIQKFRSEGRVVTSNPLRDNKQMFDLVDALEDDMVLSLTRQLIRVALSHYRRGRWAADHIESDKQREEPIFGIEKNIFDSWMEHRAVDNQNNGSVTHHIGVSPRISRAHSYCTVLELLRTVMLKEWNGKALIPKNGLVAGAAGCLQALCGSTVRLLCRYKLTTCAGRNVEKAGLKADDFCTPFLVERLDLMETAKLWIADPVDSSSVHLFSYSFLFPPTYLLAYFRAANHAAMFRAYESSLLFNRLFTEMNFTGNPQGQVATRHRESLDKTLKSFFVLEVSRSNILTDALNQIWRRERREMLKPLRVRIGAQEGEEGEDHGGVQQEFIRIAIGEAMRADYGLFATDDETRMSWFLPSSLEPLYKFELLGLLVSLAVYNGLTLPFTFPLALYRKLLEKPVTQLEHIEDGWPVLAKGLNGLLKWDEGDVEDVFMRTYVFSTDTPIGSCSVNIEPGFGQDLEFSPDQLAEREVPMVDNKNRHQYVDDYILWLTDRSIREEYRAFEKGFFTCLDRKAVSLFNPTSLKLLVEGNQEIDVDALEKTATYDGYSAEEPLMQDFWQIIRSFSPEQLRKLLEFVTASDRVPFDGIVTIDFTIQKNGDDDARLPSSATCFGRLLLPAYSSKEKMEERLRLAIENSQGFGTA
ncbi:MAG: hypothetical protein Q9195_000164 [Heterodermia aff. obscurata]